MVKADSLGRWGPAVAILFACAGPAYGLRFPPSDHGLTSRWRVLGARQKNSAVLARHAKRPATGHGGGVEGHKRKRDVLRELLTHAVFGRPDGGRALIRSSLEEALAVSTSPPPPTPPAMPHATARKQEQQISTAATEYQTTHVVTRQQHASHVAAQDQTPTLNEGFSCDLQPTLRARRPQEGEIESACVCLLCEGEADKLLQMRAMLAPQMPQDEEWLPDVHGDVRLLRFLRKCKGDVLAAVGWYRKMLRWRHDHHVDAVRLRLGLC